MIDPAIDQDGRLQWVSIVPPLTDEERAALRQAFAEWKRYQPIICIPESADIQIIQLSGRFEPELEDTP